MKKIGILTVYESANLGSYFQALGVQEVVKREGNIPYFIKFRSNFDTFLVFQNIVGGIKYKNNFKVFIKRILQPKVFIKSCIKYFKYKRDWKKFDNVISIKKANKLGLDILLCGSDEIWNIEKSSFRNPTLWGHGIKSNKRYGYAISVGGMGKEKWEDYPHLVNEISNFDRLYVRDKNTKEVLESYGYAVNDRICDPTLQVEIKKYMRSKFSHDILKYRYLIIYTYTIKEQDKRHIIRFAKENNLKIASLSLYLPWTDYYLNISPLEFGAVLKNADYVYTTTFHGTIFSTLYEKKFVVRPISSKVNDVLEQFGNSYNILENELSYQEFCDKMMQTRDYCVVNNNISILQKKSVDIAKELLV